MPLQSTSGAASYDAFGGGAAAKVNYIEDFFQSYLRTGTGASATVTTGLDGSTKETLVWTKSRSAATNHKLTDNVRGATKALSSNTTGAEATDSQGLTAFSATGYTIGTNTDYNNSGATYVDWQWVAQPKFFDIVTYTGDGTGPRAISHNLGSTPGCIFVKRTSGSQNWEVYHRSLTSNQYYLELNQTSAQDDSGQSWDVTSTTFNANSNLSLNTNGATYVAYLFAHDAGGFGLTGTDNVISCGSYVGDGTTNGSKKITLGYEPQFIIMKPAQAAPSGFNGWNMLDIMRGIPTGGYDPLLSANSGGSEDTTNDLYSVEADGFRHTYAGTAGNDDGITYLYIAIRRGPMKVPTSGTSVYNGITRTGTGAATNITGAGFPIDLLIQHERATSNNIWTTDRLRGTLSNLDTQSTAAENTNSFFQFDKQDGFGLVGAGANVSGRTMIDWVFRRTPSVFDVVCYTGNGSTQTITHNLTAVPELMLIKQRSGTNGWPVYSSGTGNTKFAYLNQTSAFDTNSSAWNNTSPTSSVFTVGSGSLMNTNAQTYVAYLFATCAGVSKVGSYTGTATTLQIDCGFTAGSRFVLIKRTDSTGSWYVWDSSRGIVSGNDPYVLLNSANVEVTNTDYIDTYSAGFEISSTAPADINASGGTFVFLAIA